MAKLKSELIGLGKQLDEGLQQSGVRLKIGWRLEKNRPQLARLTHGLQALQETPKRRFRVFEPTKMGDDLMGLGSKAEVRSGAGCPILNRRSRGKPAKGRVQLHGIQLRGVELQK